MLDLLDRLHLARPAVQVYELALAAKASVLGRNLESADGIALPPAHIRAQVGPLHANAQFFLDSGRHNAELIRSLLREDGSSVEGLESLLDWGCGVGRVLRHWADLDQTHVCGCDINPKMVEWCNAHLSFADVAVNDLSPPLPYDESTFRLVYAFSVMTHLSEELQYAWITECRRVLKLGGYLVFSTLGEHFVSRDRLTEGERQTFASGRLVVLYEGSSGTSLCSAYHPPDYVRTELGAGFDYVTFRPAADDGRHDIHMLRKRGGP